eukprot:gene23025-29213_t
MLAIRDRVTSLTDHQLSGNWNSVRSHLLWASGLKDFKGQQSGVGNTENAFNDFNHCDVVAVKEDFVSVDGSVASGMVHMPTTTSSNISAASLRDLGSGGSWATCMVGCNEQPSSDTAHGAFKARIAFKLGTPSGQLPDLMHRVHNFQIVRGSKYSTAANILSTCAHRPPAPLPSQVTSPPGPTAAPESERYVKQRQRSEEEQRIDRKVAELDIVF